MRTPFSAGAKLPACQFIEVVLVIMEISNFRFSNLDNLLKTKNPTSQDGKSIPLHLRFGGSLTIASLSKDLPIVL